MIIHYIRVGDCLKEHNPIQFTILDLSDSLWTYHADLNELAQQHMEILIAYLSQTIWKSNR